MTDETYDIRPLTSPADFKQCLELQRITWGENFAEFVPPAILKISQLVSGVAAGAFDENGKMVGFVFGLSGLRNGKPAHWSHMLAVRPELRDRGIGRELKLYQRSSSLDSGIETIYWTFDPLVARNAHFNLNVLGVVVEEYIPDMYGDEGCGTLDDIIGTDRFLVRWDLTKEPNETGKTRHGASTAARLVPIPGDIHELKAEDPQRAAKLRETTRKLFMDSMGRGYRVVAFSQRADGDGLYCLEPPTG